jgi:hypothetical protein
MLVDNLAFFFGYQAYSFHDFQAWLIDLWNLTGCLPSDQIETQRKDKGIIFFIRDEIQRPGIL